MMNASFHRWLLLALLALGAGPSLAQQPDGAVAAARALPYPPSPVSPVDTFRTLLNTNADGRERVLATKSPAQRQYLEAKIREYESMTAEQREVRLQALQLRWYMLPLMKMNAVERAARLATIPDPYRTNIQSRMRTWDILPPALRQDILDNEIAIRFLVRAESHASGENFLRALSAQQQAELQRQVERWNNLSPGRREGAVAQFDRYFELDARQKNQTLARLTEVERAQMNQSLASYDRLSREERQQAMEGFKKFAGLSASERAAFLKTAERWSAMSEADREAWRKMLNKLQTAKIMPPPLSAGRAVVSLVGTNF